MQGNTSIRTSKMQLQSLTNTESYPLSIILPLSSTTGTTMQFVPPSAAVSPGGLSLPQLAAEWNNHAVTPQEQKGPNPSARKPTLPFGGVFVTQRVTALNAFS